MGEKNKDDNVKVIVRCRPLNQKDKDSGHKMTVKCDDVNGMVTIERPNDPPKQFTFDTVFGPERQWV